MIANGVKGFFRFSYELYFYFILFIKGIGSNMKKLYELGKFLAFILILQAIIFLIL